MSLAGGCNLVIPPPKQTLSVTQTQTRKEAFYSGKITWRKYFDGILRELQLMFRYKVRHIRPWISSTADCEVQPFLTDALFFPLMMCLLSFTVGTFSGRKSQFSWILWATGQKVS